MVEESCSRTRQSGWGGALGVAAVLAALSGCATPVRAPPGSEHTDRLTAMEEEDLAAAAAPARGRLTAFADGDEDADVAPPRAAAGRRLMIYSARFELLVASVKDAVRECLEKVEELGGYLQSRDDASLTFRVPAESLEELIKEISALGLVVRQAMKALDVTRLHVDLRLRLETAEKSRERLLAILEKAEKVEDILKIESEVRRLTEEIERLKGELKHLDEQIAYSTVEVLFRARTQEPAPVKRRLRSRFDWINRIGVENVLESF
jgi:hypothetical protein